VRLVDYLAARAESQNRFAKRAGIPQSTINLICQGGGTTAATALRIIRATNGNVKLEDLTSGEPDSGAAA
jgi:DNA-binding transcriptional regulator YdaS (Cro superfamily)